MTSAEKNIANIIKSAAKGHISRVPQLQRPIFRENTGYPEDEEGDLENSLSNCCLTV